MKDKESNWYSFHFGSDYVNKKGDLSSLFGQVYPHCYVLFADFCNFTKFFSSSDNLEDIESLIRRYYMDARKIIHKYQGVLDKIMGDGFLVVWGIRDYDVAVEGNILKAVKELNQLSLDLAEKWQSQLDIEIPDVGMKFGLSEGRLITINRNDAYPGMSILGDPINMASRLQGLAKAQTLVCSNRAFNGLKPVLKTKIKGETAEIKGFGRVKYYTLNTQDCKVAGK